MAPAALRLCLQPPLRKEEDKPKITSDHSALMALFPEKKKKKKRGTLLVRQSQARMYGELYRAVRGLCLQP